MNSILETILSSTRVRVDQSKLLVDLPAIRARARNARSVAEPHAFRSAIATPDRLNIIAEFKKASPSNGVINALADPIETARAYEARGASAISVLTEPDYFRGSLDDLRAIRAAVSIPLLRKDFIVEEYQIYEAAEAGADAVLLIVAALTTYELEHFRGIAEDELGMDALIEVHTEDEMRKAAEIGGDLIGVNNRDLRTFDVSVDVSRRLVHLAPESAVLISESGLKTRDEMLELQALGYSAFLVGETLMRGSDSILAEEALP